MSTVEPLVFLSAINKFGTEDDAWTLSEASEDELRQFRTRVDFDQSFRAPPIVHLGLAGFDISNEGAARVRVHAENVSTSGFDVVAETWHDTRVYSFEVSWLAVGT